MSTRLAAKKSADGNDTGEESELAAAVLAQEARLEGLRIAGEELEERLKRDLLEAVDLALGLFGVHHSAVVFESAYGGRRVRNYPASLSCRGCGCSRSHDVLSGVEADIECGYTATIDPGERRTDLWCAKGCRLLSVRD